MAAAGAHQVDSAERAVAFAGVMLLLAGALSVIQGIAALSGSGALAESPELIVGSSNEWGTALVVLGCAAALMAFSLWVAAGVRWIAVALAATSAVVQLLFMPGYPVWSLAVVALDVLVIHALVTSRRS